MNENSDDADTGAEALAELHHKLAERTGERDDLLRQQAVLADVLKEISRQALDPRVLLNKLLEGARELCSAPQGFVLLRNEDSYRLVVHAGLPSDFEGHLTSTKSPLNSICGASSAAFTGNFSHVCYVHDGPDYRSSEGDRLGGIRSLLSVPLICGQRVIGVISLGRTSPDPFTRRHIDLVRAFADQAVIAIDHSRLFIETREALDGQTATAEILKVIAGSPSDVKPVFDAIAERARLLCGARVGATTRFDGELLHLVGYHGASAEGEAAMRGAFPMKPGRGSVNARAILARAPVQVVDVHLDPEYRVTDPAEKSGFRCGLGVPLLFEGQAIGSIFVGRAEPGAFSERLISLLQTFADQAVIAIENVRLFNEVKARTMELAASLDDLRAAQKRLVQTEKLASLGQLAAGIAHEIKNPLNFVNNFAELSAELVDELNATFFDQSLDAKKQELLEEITVTLKSNLQKVVQHGRRADSIVKNMLLHSREVSGAHCSADINAMVDESLNLAYHGARAENAGFNIALRRDLDPSVGLADIFPQEMTRVLLNLISNGFYAAAKRNAAEGDDFEPMLTAATKNLGDRIQIRIRDNGSGIAKEAQDKIFNPFFTTKPAGEGTGLGLSMSHDIVVKQHGGEIDVETEPGVFTEFVVTLPRKAARF
jgi:two-component system, NtrC family, sensor kinase